MRRWYAITTKAGPFTPAKGLRDQGIGVYIAKKHAPYRPVHDARRLFVTTTLRLDGYMFVFADADLGELVNVSNTRGVGGLVPPYPALPFPIDDDVIDGLRQAEDEEMHAIRQQAATKGSPFPLGSTVRIMRGKIRDADQAGMHGQVVGYSKGILTLFVGSWTAKVSENDVVAVESNQGGKP